MDVYAREWTQDAVHQLFTVTVSITGTLIELLAFHKEDDGIRHAVLCYRTVDEILPDAGLRIVTLGKGVDALLRQLQIPHEGKTFRQQPAQLVVGAGIRIYVMLTELFIDQLQLFEKEVPAVKVFHDKISEDIRAVIHQAGVRQCFEPGIKLLFFLGAAKGQDVGPAVTASGILNARAE
ncbi:MAG: hypothetical protein ACI4WX_07195 [Aristaeellaceae bacterium]